MSSPRCGPPSAAFERFGLVVGAAPQAHRPQHVGGTTHAATSGDFLLATTGDIFAATDKPGRLWRWHLYR